MTPAKDDAFDRSLPCRLRVRVRPHARRLRPVPSYHTPDDPLQYPRRRARAGERPPMLDLFRKLRYAARVVLSRKGGEPETIDVAGKPTVLIHGGDGPPFVYLHSTLGESFRWFPFHDAWAKHFTVYAPLHPGFGASGGFDKIDS